MKPAPSLAARRTSVGLIGNDGQVEPNLFQSLPGVLEVIPVSHSYKQVSREWKEENTVVSLPNGTQHRREGDRSHGWAVRGGE